MISRWIKLLELVTKVEYNFPRYVDVIQIVRFEERRKVSEHGGLSQAVALQIMI
jgi:hypothetical protein